MLPLQRDDGKGFPLLKLTPSPACKAAPTCVMQGHQTASSLSAWLLLSLSLCLCLSPFPSLSPSLLFLSLSQYSTDTAPPPASLISHIRYSFKKTHSTWLSAQTTLTQRGREQQTEGEGGRESWRFREGLLRQTYCINVNNCEIFTLAYTCRDINTHAHN